ncbi:MAG: hypothetical protein MUP17_09960 [candidate division Zixibacteria bacterium]|nr:hypothetical protein [candidate division Zixibacteria bacterium]
MAERKNLTITQVKEIEKVGDKQIPKLSFTIKGQEEKHSYFTFRPSLFEAIKQGQTISVDIETEIRGEYTNHKIVQIYIDGQPMGGKKEGYRGKSPEELEQSLRSQCCSYAKDLAVADKIKVVGIINQADVFYNWVKKSEPKAPETKLKPETQAPSEAKTPAPEEKAKVETPETNAELVAKAWEKIGKESPSGKAIPNITDFKKLLMNHKIPTHEAKEILSIKDYDELTDLDEAWEKIKKAKGIK